MAVSLIISKTFQVASALWCNAPLIVAAIVGVSFLIAFHEFGHLLFAKLFNVYAPSFSIGFGPRIIEKKIGETTYALSAIPLGGYVELAGSAEMGQGEQTHAHDTSERSFAAKPYWQKLLIMVGGIGFNLLFAYAAFVLLFALGAPCIGSWCQDKPATIGVVHDNTPAAQAGLQPGDILTSVDGTPTPTIESLTKSLELHIKRPVTIGVKRAGEEQILTITPDEQTVGTLKKPLIGVAWYLEPMSILQAKSAAWKATWALVTQTAGAIKNLTKSHEGVGGPLMLICQVTQFAGMGFKMFLFMLVFISINLAVFNLLPLPIFDGGQVLFFTIEAIIRRPLSDKAREAIHYYTWIGVLALVAYLTLKDVIKLSSWF